MCYGIGILVGNLSPEWVDKAMCNNLAAAGMIIALPLLLFGSRIQENWRLAGPGLVAFGLCALAGLICTAFAAFLFSQQQDDGWVIAGMLTGLYTGGTPNLQAIGLALDAPENYVVLLQAADIIGGGIYLFLLMTVIHPLLGLFLPDFQAASKEDHPTDTTDELLDQPALPIAEQRVTWQAIVLSIAIGGIAVGLTFLATGGIDNSTLIIVFLTTISLAVSFSPTVNRWKNTYDQGEYFVLIFCVALGLLADFREMMGEGLPLLAFSIVALISTILLHWLFAWLFQVDRDTVMISSTAALYGPVFIAQITTSIPNRQLLAPGIALSLLGLALGNYLGIGIAYAARWLFW